MQKQPNLFNDQPLSSDQTERYAIADAMKFTLDKKNAQDESPTSFYTTKLIDIEQLVTSTVEGSHFDKIHRPAKTLLRRLVANPHFVTIIEKLDLPENNWTVVNQDGGIYQVYASQKDIGTYIERTNITTDVNSNAALKSEVELLTKSAILTGGIVSSTERIPLINWLKSQQLDVPNTTDAVENLIDYFRFSPPPPPELGNYWGISGETHETTLIVAENQHSIISLEVSKLMAKVGSVPDRFINYLTEALPKKYSRVLLEESPGFSWEVLIDTDEAKHFAQSCFNALNPQAPAPDKPMAAVQRSRILIAAIMLDLDLGTEKQRKHFHDGELYTLHHQNTNVFEARKGLKAGFVAIGVNPDTATLTLELVLSGLAPEFLVNTPPSLQVGSSGWVMLHKSVMLAERIAPGLSRNMRYEQLLELGAISPVSSEQKTLHDLITLQCIVDWALINELNPNNSENLPSEEITKNAATHYSVYTGEITDAISAISAQPVSRKQLARETILGETLLHPEEKLFPVDTSKWSPGHYRSVLDLYMNNDLNTKHWDRENGTSIFKQDLDLATLEPINKLYENQVKKHYDSFKPGLITMIRLALSRLRKRDRVAIEYGNLAIYQVLGSRYIPGHSADETAPFGIVIVSWFDNEIHCYELFPLQGLCLKNEDLVQAYIRGVPFNEDTGDFDETPNGNNGHFQRLTYLQHIFADNEAYFSGSKPIHHEEKRTSRLLPDNFRDLDEYLNISGVGMLLMRLGAFDDRSQSAYYNTSMMESFNSERFKEIGNLITGDSPPITYEQFYAMGYDKTAIEERDESLKKIVDTILDVIIPFKGCIEGLASSDSNRRSGAIFSCVMDVIAVALVFAGGVGPFLKAAASSAKLLNLSKVAAGVVVSIFNPLDGVPKLVQGGAKLVGRGALKLSHYGHSVTKVGARQLQRLTSNSSGSYDLIKALNKTGSAAEIRMTLPTVAHGRTLLKDDSIETVEHVLSQLGNKNTQLLDDATDSELEYLFNNALNEATLKLKDVQELESLIGRAALDDLMSAFLKQNSLNYAAARSARGADNYPAIFESFSKMEQNNIIYMKNHQQKLLQEDLGKAPYDAIKPDSDFNPQGLTNDAERAAAWIAHSSKSEGNDWNSLVAVLREYADNGKDLTDPALIRELHKRVAPVVNGDVRITQSGQPYASSISGFSALQQHLKTLDSAHEQLGKQLYGAVTGFHGLGDGNGRTARSLYAITELRNQRFNPMTTQLENALSGLK
jgi:hypothetical protein